MPTNSYESPESLDEARVEELLTELEHEGVLLRMRSLVQASDTMFDSERGYVVDNDDSRTGDVLDMFRDGISEKTPLALRGIEEPEMQEAIMQALETDSDKRKVLLAYWGVTENSPWWQTEQNIPSMQTFKEQEFPQFTEIERTMKNIDNAKQEEAELLE